MTLLLGNSPRPRPRLVFRGFEDEDEDEQEPALAAICNRVKLHPSLCHYHRTACATQQILFQFRINIIVIGGGPAGLRAAEIAKAGGAAVTLFDAKPSVGRKLLVAGRGGLNLTHAEPLEKFSTRYTGSGQPENIWAELLAEFDATALRQWAAELGVETFAATSGRVYPRELKAAPLLRNWVRRLRASGVKFALRHRWTGLHADAQWQVDFQTGDEARTARSPVQRCRSANFTPLARSRRTQFRSSGAALSSRG